MQPSRGTVIFVALAMTIVGIPGSALATHNSIGGEAHVMQADEAEVGAGNPQAGTITPDIEGGPYADRAFHHTLKEDGLVARSQPDDQSGQRYRADQCDTFGEIQENGDSQGDGYNPSSDSTDCYIGFMDHQLEYVLARNLFLTFQSNDFVLYFLNPAPNDDYCHGRNDTANRSAGGEDVPVVLGDDSAADEGIARGLRSTESRCDGSGHRWGVPNKIAVDTNILETPSRLAGQAAGTDTGSGAFSLPLISNPYLYLFGQPHANTTDEKRTGVKAGEGPFGPAGSGAFGSPIADITGACGDRTKTCELLGPEDIKNYDTNWPSGEPSQARVCKYHPRYSFSEAGTGDTGRGGLKCGVTGALMGVFVGGTTFGGLGVSDTPTWASNLPGWYYGVVYDPRFQTVQFNDTTIFVPNADNPERVNQSTVGLGGPLGDFVQDYRTEEQGARLGYLNYVAVNPKVPQPQDTLRCVTPGFLAEGDDSKLPDTSFSDPGVYGTYVADGVDVDIYPHPLRRPLADTRDATHDTVYENVAAPAQTIAQDTRDAIGDASTVLPPSAAELVSRADPREVSDPEPKAQPGPQNPYPFEDEVAPGFDCEPNGDLRFRTESSFRDGGLRFDANLLETTDLKDPTVSDEILPRPANETDNGAWMPDLYSFDGVIHAVLDSNQNGEFDSCPGASFGPDDDACPWMPFFDAYNPACSDVSGTSCETVLRDRGYNVSRGVGMFFTLNLTGPAAILSDTTTETDSLQDRLHVLGTDDTTARNCVIGISRGFAPRLAGFIGTDQDDPSDPAVEDSTFDLDDREALCPDQAGDGNGDVVVIRDAFDDQNGDVRGEFGGAINWLKLLPTPATVQDSTGFGAQDDLCANAIFTVDDTLNGEVVNDTATGDDNGIADDTEETPGDPGQENIVLRNGVHRFTDCDTFDTTGEPQE